MNYNEAIDFLYNQLPMYQRVGAPAYKPGLDTCMHLAGAFDNPQNKFKSVHIGGTNGKGSTAHTLAAIMQSAGYKVGLYTSPHLIDFRERIRINGEMISKDAVTDFISRFKSMYLTCSPSFFELTMIMAFEYFAKERVDIAMIEVGLGGRLDSTNIITPELCVITNISFDHMQFLGNTLESIAREKAGIIKNGIPVVIGEAAGEVRKVFEHRAQEVHAPIVFADESPCFSSWTLTQEGICYKDTVVGDMTGVLRGEYQLKNTATILCAVEELRTQGWKVSDDAVKTGFAHVDSLTGLSGRWMKISDYPLTVCDTGHNEGGWQYLSHQISQSGNVKHLVIGFVSDKDVSHILGLMPKDARYYFTRPSISRGMDENMLAEAAKKEDLHGEVFSNVKSAYCAAKSSASADDFIYVGGSTFVVADFLSYLSEINAQL